MIDFLIEASLLIAALSALAGLAILFPMHLNLKKKFKSETLKSFEHGQDTGYKFCEEYYKSFLAEVRIALKYKKTSKPEIIKLIEQELNKKPK